MDVGWDDPVLMWILGRMAPYRRGYAIQVGMVVSPDTIALSLVI